MKCSKCENNIVEHSSCGTGYGIDKDNNKVCYVCCAEQDKEHMRTTGHIVLYLVKEERRLAVTNWPDSLSFVVSYYKTGRHNIAGVRYDVWFMFEGQQWHGVQYGDNTELCHCRRNKTTSY